MKLIVFDCDGTLVDSQHMIVAAMSQAFAGRNLAAPPREEILSVVGLSLTLAVSRLVTGIDAQGVDQLAEDYKTAFGALRQDPQQYEPLYPGVREVLDELVLRDNTVLGIATGKSRRGVAAVLERERMAQMFATIQTADTHPSKPDPSMIMTAMAETGCSPDDTVMIGDTTFDMEMARAAGVRAIGVGWGYHPPEALEEAGAHAVVHDAETLRTELHTFTAGVARNR